MWEKVSMDYLRTWLDEKLQDRERALNRFKLERKKLTEAQELESDILQAQKIVQDLAQEVQTKAHKGLAKVVSKCLSAVFGKGYKLKIEFERKRGRTEASFVYLKDGRKINPRVSSGGVRHVAALALRLACLVMTQPARRRLLVLDEPFQGVSRRNLEKMAAVIETLGRELKVQFIIVTHSKNLEVGKMVQL